MVDGPLVMVSLCGGIKSSVFVSAHYVLDFL